jgi:hypothetical protein
MILVLPVVVQVYFTSLILLLYAPFRLASICSEKAKIAKAVEDSNSELIVINEDKNKIRRNPSKPLPKLTG